MENLDYSKRIKDILKELGLTQAALAAKMGLSQGVISEFSSGAREPSKDFIFGISKLGISVDWFLTGNGRMFSSESLKLEESPQKPPLIMEIEEIIAQNLKPLNARINNLEALINGNESHIIPDFEYYESDTEKVQFVYNIAAGPFISQMENSVDYIDVPRTYIKTAPEDYYAAHIKGQSMTEAGIPDDSIVLIRQSNIPKDEKIQVVWHDGKTTLKRLKRDENNQWQLCYEDGTGRCIEIKQGEAYHILGDFVAVLPIKNDE